MPRRTHAASSRLRNSEMRRAAHRDELFDQIAHRPLREPTIADIIVLLKTLQRRSVSPRNAQGAIGEDALGVADMAENFLGAPFLRRVAEVALLLIAAGEQQHRFAALLVERIENVVAPHQGNVALVIGRVFARLGPGNSEG